MTQIAGNDRKQEYGREEQAPSRGKASEHGHTGEGSASVLAHLISQNEKQRRQNGETSDTTNRDTTNRQRR